MGVEWGATRIVIKPYRGTRTLRNLRATGTAVVNLTDDILLFSQAALGDPHPPTHPAAGVEGAVLDDACSWREVRVEAIDDSGRVRCVEFILELAASVERLTTAGEGLEERVRRLEAEARRDSRTSSAPPPASSSCGAATAVDASRRRASSSS